jgi:hypothetical protein
LETVDRAKMTKPLCGPRFRAHGRADRDIDPELLRIRGPQVKYLPNAEERCEVRSADGSPFQASGRFNISFLHGRVTMNIVEMILKMLGGDAGKQLAALIGEGEDSTGTAVKAVVPALLAALTGISSVPEGARKLASAVESADDSILSNLGNLLKGQGSNIADQGTSIIGSLFSGGILSNLRSVLSQSTGIGLGSITTLLGSLAPVILGSLKRETKSAGFDPAALSKLLLSQKESIAQALPIGLAGQLAGIPGLGAINSIFQGSRGTVTTAENRATAAENQAKAAAAETAGTVKWIVPLLVLLGAGWLLWKFWPSPETAGLFANRNQQKPITVTAAKVTDEIVQQLSTATTGVTDFFRDATHALERVTDVSSAEQAAEKLPGLVDRLADLKRLIVKLPESQGKTIVTSIAKSRESLFALIKKLEKIPGVADVLAPHVEKLRAALDELAA